MTVQSRTTLKSYFITGASPSEANFGDLIDSTLLVGDIVDSLTSTSSVNPLSASSGKILNDSITSLTARVVTLESQETDFASNYYTKTEVDTQLQAVDTVINSLTYQSQINDLQTQIDSIEVGGSPTSSISIASVTGLQSALDTKATVAELNDVRDSLIASINAIDTGGESVDLTGINASISALNDEIDALESQLANKADTGHTHGNIYTKTEVDSLINNIDTSDHTHVSADITDLGSEIQQKTNLLLSDHSNLTNNPHSVTKEQIGLGKVENLTPSEIISQAGGVSQDDITSIQTQLDTHAGATNPHGLQKSDIGLGNVPNVNPQALLDAHLAEDNPHNIDLTFFDVYTTAESDARTIFHIDAVRYAFTPLSGSDSAGAVGDIAYDADNLYFKTGSTQWKRIEFSPVGGDSALQIELDATQLGAGLGVDGVYTANSSTNYLSSATSLKSADEALDVQLKSVADAVASNDSDISLLQQNVGSNDTDITNLQSELDATQLGAGLGTDGTYTANSSSNYISTVTSLQNADDLLDAQVKTNATDIANNALDIATNATDIADNATDIATNATDIATNASDIADLQTKTDSISTDGSSADIKFIDTQEVEFIENWATKQSSEKLVYNFNTTRLKIGTAEVATLTDLAGFVTSLELQNALANLDLTGGSTDSDGNSTDGGTETDLVLDGTTGGVNSGYAVDGNGGYYAIDYGGDGVFGTGDDDEVEYWALDTSSLINTGLLINIGLGQYNPYLRYDVTLNNWQIYNGGSTNSPYEIKESYSKTESDGKYALATDITPHVDAYTKTESDGKYALTTDITPHVDAYTKTESDDKYALLSDTYTRSVADTKYALKSRVAMTNGTGGTSIIAEGLSSGSPATTGFEINYGASNNPYIRFDVTDNKWYAYNGVSQVEIGAVVNNTTINEGDNVTNTTVLNQTIVQQNLTVDGTSGGAESGYAYTEYDDGTGTLVGEKYSIDYGADSTYGTADDDDTEDYWDIDASSYENAGLTVNAGLDPNPSIKYDGTSNMWLVENGEYGSTDYGSFHLKDVDAAVSALVDSAPNTLNTLNELAAALGDDPSFATTTSTALGNRVRVDTASQNLSSTQKSNARTNIGAQVAGSYAASSHNHSAGNITSGTLSISRIPTGTSSTTVCRGDDSRLSDARTPTSHTHDDRYYTESEMRHILSRAHGWASAYGTSSESATNWSVVEDALEIDSTDSSIGATYKAIRIQKGDIVRFTVMVKGSAASGSGLYLRIYGDNALDDAKTHISITTGETDVQLVSTASTSAEYPYQRTNWQENKPITTSWKDYTYDYVAHDDGFISLNVLNWSGHGTNSLFVKNPDIQVLASGQYSYAT